MLASPTYFLVLAVPPLSVFHSRIATAGKARRQKFQNGTNSTGVGTYHSLTPHNLNGRFGVLEDPLFCKRKYINLLSPINQCCIEFEASSVKHALVS